MNKVLTFDGNYLNSRHLTELVDTMTRYGTICPVSRHGMARSQLGVLLRASFEETKDVFTNAAIFSAHDSVDGVSESIMFGNLARIGSGAFDIVLPPSPARTRAPRTPVDADADDRFVGRRKRSARIPRLNSAPPVRWNPRVDPRAFFVVGGALSARSAPSPAPRTPPSRPVWWTLDDTVSSAPASPPSPPPPPPALQLPPRRPALMQTAAGAFDFDNALAYRPASPVSAPMAYVPASP